MYESVPYLREWLESWFWRLEFLSIKTVEAALDILWHHLYLELKNHRSSMLSVVQYVVWSYNSPWAISEGCPLNNRAEKALRE